MKEQYEKRLKSTYRDNSVDDNLTLWEEMKLGTEKGQKYCVRAKIDYESTNRCMRDPTIYRWKPEHHPLETNTRCILCMILPIQFLTLLRMLHILCTQRSIMIEMFNFIG